MSTYDDAVYDDDTYEGIDGWTLAALVMLAVLLVIGGMWWYWAIV